MLLRFGKLLFIIALLILALSGCAGKRKVVQPSPPPVSNAKEIPATPEPMHIISIRLEEVRLNPDKAKHNVALDSIWMIPLTDFKDKDSSADVSDMGAEFHYFEDKPVLVTTHKPYKPTSKWFISINKNDLQENDFGIWFILTSNEYDVSNALMHEFQQLMNETLSTITYSMVTSVLFTITPGMPDEAVFVAATISHGKNMMGRISALISLTPAFFYNSLKNVAPETAKKLGQNISRISDIARMMDYYGEVLILFSPEDNYRLNNRIIAETTDGALTLEFSVFESFTNTKEIAERDSSEFSEIVIPAEACNEIESTIISGQTVEVVVPYIRIYQNPINVNAADVGRINNGQQFIASVSYCNQETQTQWWSMCMGQTCGWVAESDNHNKFLKGIISK